MRIVQNGSRGLLPFSRGHLLLTQQAPEAIESIGRIQTCRMYGLYRRKCHPMLLIATYQTGIGRLTATYARWRATERAVAFEPEIKRHVGPKVSPARAPTKWRPATEDSKPSLSTGNP